MSSTMVATVGGAEIFFRRGIIDAHQKVPGAPPGACCSRADADKILRATRNEQEAFMKTLARLALAALAAPALAADPAVPYPEGYRNWTHVKSMVIQQGHPLAEAFGGIHHVYANDKAMAGYRKGTFPDGAIIVFDLLEAKTGGGAIEEGTRKVVGVMMKGGSKWKETGGWGFEGFKGDSKTERAVGGNAGPACYECHTQVKGSDYVFSRWRR
jgi:hypothetical protein